MHRFFDKGPSGPVATTSLAARVELETFAALLREAVGGQVVQVRVWPYRYGDTTCWSFDVDGCDGASSLTFEENGRTRLPHESPYDGTGSVADSVDAFYLFEFLERELSYSSGGF
jgi:hypothetical protein